MDIGTSIVVVLMVAIVIGTVASIARDRSRALELAATQAERVVSDDEAARIAAEANSAPYATPFQPEPGLVLIGELRDTQFAGRAGDYPFCSNARVWVGWNDMETTHAALAAEWDYEMNADLTPRAVIAGTTKRIHWKCVHGHTWQAKGADRVIGNGCPFCGNRRVWVGWNDLQTTHPKLAAQWDLEMNGALTPRDVVAGNSTTRVFWKCERGHGWRTSVSSRSGRGSGCPTCHAEAHPRSISPRVQPSRD